MAATRAFAATTVPIEIREGHIYVQTRLPQSDVPLAFLIDSGAATPVNLLAKAAAARLGIKGAGTQKAGAIGGKVQVTFTPPIPLTLGTLVLKADKLAIIPLGDTSEERAVGGILGYAFFAACNPVIDYPHKRMTLFASPARPHGGVPLTVMSKNAVIAATVVLAIGDAPVPVRLIVDTGYDGGLLLTSPFVRTHNLLSRAGAPETGTGVGGVTRKSHLSVPRLAIGSTTATNIDTALSTDTEGAFASVDVDGYVGGDFLKAYVVTFDYKHGRFVLRRP